MRKQFVKTSEEVLKTDPRLVVLLGDIGVFGFRNAFAEHPRRVYNIGILEQATVSMAAGLAMQGFIPVVHTIAPFLVERSFEQIKDDFGYQELGGNFVSVGASYDYAALGCTHHCPGDVGILKNIPDVEIVVPGTALEFDTLFKTAYADGKPTYYRLSERSNPESMPVEFGKAHVVKKGTLATVIAVGPMLGKVMEACSELDVTVLYYTTVAPFDTETLRTHLSGDTIITVEPYYAGALSSEIAAACERPIRQLAIGVPREFLHSYGTLEDHDRVLGLTAEAIRAKIQAFL